MSFRAKKAPYVLAELEGQKARYKAHRFMAVDNILPHEYFKTLLPELKQRKLGITLFYEIKANLKREQVELLRDAGVMALQPGIENLSTPVLRIMRKGTTGLQNVQMLRLAREYGIHLVWNLLYGFPGEQPEHYAETPSILDAIAHLSPPASVSPIRLDRFSPNFSQAAEFGFVDVRPFSTYQHLYPLPPERVANLAYFFRYNYADGHRCDTYMQEIVARVETWKRSPPGDLVLEWSDDAELAVVDTRLGRPARRFTFDGLERELYELCGEARSRANLLAHARAHAARNGAPADDGAVAARLDAFLLRMTGDQLMLREGDQFLSLAVNPTLNRRAGRMATAAALAALS
jgi:ribosomal peptide maturation radical SAM protein 1